MTKREAISILRDKIKERSIDTTYTNFFLYKVLEEQFSWLIRRDIARVYKSTELFQVLKEFQVDEILPSDCEIDTNCRMFRTRYALPEIWIDDKGPVIRSITSIDFSTAFTRININEIKDKLVNPYVRIAKEKYYYFLEGYIYFLDFNPNKVNISAFFKDDLSLFERKCTDCDESKDCKLYLDSKLFVPTWTLAEAQAKALDQLARVSKALPEDVQPDNNPNRKN